MYRKLFILVILLLVTVPILAQTPKTNPTSISFAPAVSYSTSCRPWSVFCADLDGDGDLDLVAPIPGGNKVCVLKNYGNATFQSGICYVDGYSPGAVFCADLDGDGDLDLALATNSMHNTVCILKNRGDGSFESPVFYGVPADPFSIFCADLDNDGDLDLAAACCGSNSVSILKNNGDGTFQPAVNYGAGDGPQSVFCADLDGDSDLDLAVGDKDIDTVCILKNNGDGTFQSAVMYATGGGFPSVFCADLDGDGDLDLVRTNTLDNNISVLKNNGNGTFQTAVSYGVGSHPFSVFCADLDGDGAVDVAVANTDGGNVSILKNNGNGTFQSAVNYATGSYPHSVFCADLDGDGDLDLAVVNRDDCNISILSNQTIATNQPPTAVVDQITPNPAHSGLQVNFVGHGLDSDGSIVGYNWRSSIDGQLSTEASFSTSSLSVGQHTIYFKVQDDDGVWSSETSQQLEVLIPNQPPTAVITYISPNPAPSGEQVNFVGYGTDSDGWIVGYNWTSSIDGQLSTQASFSTSSLSVGLHTIYFKVQDDDGVLSLEASRRLEVLTPNQLPLKVLMVDDDHSAVFPGGFTDVTSYFTDALTASGYTYAVFEVTTEGGDGPDATTMANYPVVIWSCGESWQNSQTLTSNDEANLATYLNGGGSLFLSAMDYFYDRYPSAGSFGPGQFPYDYLGVTSVSQDVWTIVSPSTGHCVGGTGSVAWGMAFDLWDPYTTKGIGSKGRLLGTDNGLYIDELVHNGTHLFQMTIPSPTGIAACQYEGAGFRTVFTTVDFASLVDGDPPSTKTALMWEIMKWLNRNYPPQADARGPYVGQKGLEIQFDASGSWDPDGQIIRYDWKWFHEDSWHIDLGAHPTHSYISPGEYTVTVRVWDNNYVFDEAQASVKVFDINNGLEGYWSFNDGTANDNSGNDHNGTLIGDPTVIDNGSLGKALMFDGKNDWVRVYDPILTDQNADFTICAWVKPYSIRSGKDHLIIDNGGLIFLYTRSEYNSDENIVNNSWQFELNSGAETQITGAGICNAGANYGMGCGSGGGCPGGECQPNLLPQWTFVCGTYEASTNLVKLYINGQMVASGTRNETYWPFEFNIGGDLSGQFFRGALDEIRLYGRLLPDDEIAFLYGYPDGNVAPLAELVKVSPPAVQLGGSVEFFGYAEDTDGSVSHYYWDFNGDNVADLTTEEPHATHQFSYPYPCFAGVGFWVEDNKGKLSLPAHDHVLLVPTNARIYLPPYADLKCDICTANPPMSYCRQNGNPTPGNIGALGGEISVYENGVWTDCGVLVDYPTSVQQNVQVDAEIISSGGKNPFSAGIGVAVAATYATMARYKGSDLQRPNYQDEIDPLLDASVITDVLDFVIGWLIPDWPWGVLNDLGSIIQNIASIDQAGELDIALKSGDREVTDIKHSFVCDPGDRLFVGLGAFSASYLVATACAGRMGEVRYIVVQEIPTLSRELVITAYCPVNIVVTDPSGGIVDKDSTTIPGATYVWGDMNSDSSIDVQVYVPDAID